MTDLDGLLRIMRDCRNRHPHLRPDGLYVLAEEHEDEYTGSKSLRLVESGYDDPQATVVPMWIMGGPMLLGKTPVQLTYFEWQGKVWGGIIAVDQPQNLQAISANRPREIIVSCYEVLGVGDV